MTSLFPTGEDVLVKQRQFSLTELLGASVDQTSPGCLVVAEISFSVKHQSKNGILC